MFRRDWTARWSDGDIFGIAYYPRIIDAMHDTADMFMEEHGCPFWELEEQYGVGLPIVEVDVEFSHPVECGDTVTIAVDTEVGEKSVRYDFRGANGEGTETFAGFEQRVCVPFDGDEAVPVPPGLRDTLEGET